MEVSKRMRNAVMHLNTHIGDEDVVEEAIEISGYSHGHFCRVFKEVHKVSLYRYLREKRLHVAAHLLLRSNSRIIDIAIELGFGSHQDFTRTFRLYYGCSPRAYRRLGKPFPVADIFFEGIAVGF